MTETLSTAVLQGITVLTYYPPTGPRALKIASEQTHLPYLFSDS